LIYFIFRDDTYFVSSIFICLMIIGGFATGVRILLEKGPSRHQVSEDQEIPEKHQKIIFCQKTEEVRRRKREEQQGRLTTRGRGPTPATLACGEATLAHYYHRPLAYIIIPENLSQGGLRDRHCHLYGAENTEREKLSGRQKSAGEIPSRRGEIVAIIIIIALDFIGIIITIITITSTFISIITTPSRCNILS
jgi:hypothetical protein